MTKVKELNRKAVKSNDHLKMIENWDEAKSYQRMSKSEKGAFNYTTHFQSEKTYWNDSVTNCILVLNGAIDMLLASVDNNAQVYPIKRVHYVVDEKAENVAVFIELKDDDVSQVIIPRFLGAKYSNVEVLRKIATNLSGQFACNMRVYL